MSFLRETCANFNSITILVGNICTYSKFRLYLHEVNKQVAGHYLAIPLDYFAAHLSFILTSMYLYCNFPVMAKCSSNYQVLLKRTQTVSIVFCGIFFHVRSLLLEFLTISSAWIRYLTNTAITYLCIFLVQQMIYNIIIIYKSPNPYMCNLFHAHRNKIYFYGFNEWRSSSLN